MRKLTSINPTDNSVIGTVTTSTENEITEKVKQAQIAKSAWRALGAKWRVEVLKPLVKLLKQKEDEITHLITREMGKPISESKEGFAFELAYVEAFLETGVEYTKDEITFQEGNDKHHIVFEPRGVAACIVPWNYPLSNFLWSVIPNLIVGNTVVFKHSEECPLFGQLMEKMMLELNELPPGVFSEIYGDGREGEFLLKQDINLICFTGSSAVGKKLWNIAGEKRIKAVLELGGSNPTILFEDVKVDSIIPNLYSARFSNCGQSCDAMKRLIVHHSLYNEVVEKLVNYAESIKIGNPEEEGTQLGPLVAMRQLELLELQVKESVKEGASIKTGGKRVKDLNGAFYLPTILTNVKSSMRVWTEEVFGPVLPIVSFDTEEEAIKLANDTKYGLGATIHSADLHRAHRVAARIEAGSIDINNGNHWKPSTPFSGFKASGSGCEHGRYGFHELCQFKVIAQG